jgi:hypothetical protein
LQWRINLAGDGDLQRPIIQTVKEDLPPLYKPHRLEEAFEDAVGDERASLQMGTRGRGADSAAGGVDNDAKNQEQRISPSQSESSRNQQGKYMPWAAPENCSHGQHWR